MSARVATLEAIDRAAGEGESRAARLMGRYCDGDVAAFRALYELVAPRVLAHLACMTMDRALAEDLLQETFAKVHRAREAYMRGANPVPWMIAIGHRACLDELRRRRRARTHLGRYDDAACERGGRLADSRDEEARTRVADEVQIAAVLDALGALPERQRDAVMLTKLQGLSTADAANALGTTRGAIKLRAHRAYESLRRALDLL
jgi:RNA polymerase sigma-70 factor (ECF subfamily)